MKKQILDTPFRDSFEDFLHKDETIQWEKTINEEIEIPVIFNDEGQWKFSFGKLANNLLFAVGITIFFFYYSATDPNLILIFLPFFTILIAFFINHRLYSTRIHPTQYAITTKRVLFRLSHLPKNEIHDIPFSQINNCIVTISEGNTGTIFLAVKNPQLIPFETFTILDNNEKEWRHQPTLESIDEVNLVAELIRKGIENTNRSV